ncbi:unnamed protein product [Vitrella brassicaformis CCMP3155]|uniref:SAG-related sequence n=1 Tax=Vitrella brassicaformis (strain CCMP3155) TaxID=1169540 RepID=A0A0G4GYR9_VITBC|nr:unnamed protein product [Vitrella brassicaformis CCMP3155]|eukprot:CEM36183.1 unnamed protein product [Vitrella brassicaformis CCMP3155]
MPAAGLVLFVLFQAALAAFDSVASTHRSQHHDALNNATLAHALPSCPPQDNLAVKHSLSRKGQFQKRPCGDKRLCLLELLPEKQAKFLDCSSGQETMGERELGSTVVEDAFTIKTEDGKTCDYRFSTTAFCDNGPLAEEMAKVLQKREKRGPSFAVFRPKKKQSGQQQTEKHQQNECPAVDEGPAGLIKGNPAAGIQGPGELAACKSLRFCRVGHHMTKAPAVGLAVFVLCKKDQLDREILTEVGSRIVGLQIRADTFKTTPSTPSGEQVVRSYIIPLEQMVHQTPERDVLQCSALVRDGEKACKTDT